jgi:selenocysteine-specific elongation factor
MPHIIGTAGHIDHGKTSLVKALTGEDTDRLAEEKARGISIELGFAHLDLPGGVRAGIVDVPGHERFIRTMLAGAHGMDLVLFTVAADDGVMPQTEEHFDILHLLSVDHAIFVVTKVDLVSDARVTEVADEIRILTAGTALEHASIVPFSFVTLSGLDALREEIARVLATIHRPAPPGFFRLPVDRAFVLQGHGLVVTGTAIAGVVTAGDRLHALPRGQTFRVRAVQVHNEPVEQASWGQRVALNLSGDARPALERGDVLCDERITSTSDRFDASLEARASAGTTAVLKHGQRVRVHLGTAERMARLILLGPRDRIDARETAFGQLVLSEPLFAARGDRFVIRDETARRTLGGGVVLHPRPPAHRRREPGLEARLRILQTGSLAEALAQVVDEHEAFAVPLAPACELLNATPGDVAGALPAAAGVVAIRLDGDSVYTTARKWRASTDALLASLRAFHAAHPLAPGQDMEVLRDTLPWPAPTGVFRAWVGQLEREGVLARDGSVVRLPGHTTALRGDARGLADHILALLGERPLTPPEAPQLAAALGIDAGRLVELLRVLEREGAIVRLARDLYMLAEALGGVTRSLRGELPDGALITLASFRERFGTSRKYAIPLLEQLDRDGVTERVGDARRVKAGAREVGEWRN